MFSGIVEAVGTIIGTKRHDGCVDLLIDQCWPDLSLGASIAINGVCLTITAMTNDTIAVTVVPETLRCSNLGLVQDGSLVNIERSLAVAGRNSGHYVQGHVDSIAEVIKIHPDGAATILTYALPGHLWPYVVHKGYLALDGMSLTVRKIIAHDHEVFYVEISIIPYTLAHTIAATYRVGSKVNIEVDILARYLEKLVKGTGLC